MKRWALLLIGACGGTGNPMNGDDASVIDATAAMIDAAGDGSQHPIDGASDAPTTAGPRTVFVIPFENKSSAAIYGNAADAPYINGLLAAAAHATNFQDALPSLPSEPHYILMEAGTNAFADRTFTGDGDAASSNSTASTAHLSTQLTAAGIPWMSYQEGMIAGTCPISSTGQYAAKHNPFVFFQDTAGSPPSSSNAACIAHHKPYSAFAADLASGIDGYVFITPNLCNDMHGALTCPSGIFDSPNIKAGDNWLKNELPRIIAYTQTHDAIIMLAWDEGDSTNLIPFIVIGTNVKPGFTSSTMFTHNSLVKSVEQFLGVPVLPTVAGANNFADMFQPSTFP